MPHLLFDFQNHDIRYAKDVNSSRKLCCPTAGVTGAGAGVDSAWKHRKLEARKMLENGAGRKAAVPSVQCTLC